MLLTTVSVIAGLVLLVLVGDAVYSFVKGGSSIKERLLAIGKSSATVAVARLGAIAGLGFDNIVSAADLLLSPSVSAAITQYVPGKAIGYTLAASAVIVEYSRRRSLRVVVDSPASPFGMAVEKAPLLGVPATEKSDA